MTPVAGPVHAVALVLLAAGMAKLVRPAGTVVALRTLRLPGARLLAHAVGITEIAVATAVLAGTGAAALAVAAVLHVGFAGVALALRHRAASCGCFGVGAPVTGTHIVIALAAAALLAGATGVDVPSLPAAAAETPGFGFVYVLLVGLLAAGEVLCLTVLPQAQVAARTVRRSL